MLREDRSGGGEFRMLEGVAGGQSKMEGSSFLVETLLKALLAPPNTGPLQSQLCHFGSADNINFPSLFSLFCLM